MESSAPTTVSGSVPTLVEPSTSCCSSKDGSTPLLSPLTVAPMFIDNVNTKQQHLKRHGFNRFDV
jgi:hypothetical protein